MNLGIPALGGPSLPQVVWCLSRPSLDYRLRAFDTDSGNTGVVWSSFRPVAEATPMTYSSVDVSTSLIAAGGYKEDSTRG